LDLMELEIASSEFLQSFDAEQLTWSILCYSLEVEMEDALLKQLIMEYANCSMLQDICCLSKKSVNVWVFQLMKHQDKSLLAI